MLAFSLTDSRVSPSLSTTLPSTVLRYGLKSEASRSIRKPRMSRPFCDTWVNI